jgi:hypothetical protein
MPNIKEFDAPSLGLQPSDRGAAAFAATGRRAGAFYSQAAQSIATAGTRLGSAVASAGDAAVNYLDHREISRGTLGSAKLLYDSTESWNTTAKNADPNDPSVAKKWLEEELEPKLQQFQDSFSTEKSQAWALHRADQIREHMFNKTSADMTTLAGVAVTNNIRNTSNIYSNTAMTDPSSVPSMLGHVDHDIEGIVSSSPNLKGADAARVRSEVSQKTKESIVKAGAFGAIQKSADPVATADEWTRKYSQYINGAEAKTLGKAAETQARVNANVEKQGKLLDKQNAELQVHTETNKAFTDNVKIDPVTGRFMVNKNFEQAILDIASRNGNAPNAASVAHTYLNWAEAQRDRKEAIVTNPETYTNLLEGMMKPEDATTDVDILKAAANPDHSKRLDDHDTRTLRELRKAIDDAGLKGPLMKTKLDAVKERLGVGVVSDGHSRYANFMDVFLPQYIALKKSGAQLQRDPLNLNDPESLISKALKDFEPDQNQRMMGHIMKNLGVGVNPSEMTFPPPPTSAPGTTKIPTSGPLTVTTQEQFDKLSKGAQYIGKDGKLYRKP